MRQEAILVRLLIGQLTAAVAQWLEHSPREWEVVGLIPNRVIFKDVIKTVPDASLLGAQHIRTGLASLSSQTSFKKRWIPSGMSGRE